MTIAICNIRYVTILNTAARYAIELRDPKTNCILPDWNSVQHFECEHPISLNKPICEQVYDDLNSRFARGELGWCAELNTNETGYLCRFA